MTPYRTNSPPLPEPKPPTPNRLWAAVRLYGMAWCGEPAVMMFVHVVGVVFIAAMVHAPEARREKAAAEAAEQARQRAEEKVNSDYAADCSRFNDAPQKDIPGRCLRHFGVGK